MRKVSLETRQWIQSLSLSLPRGVNLYCIGGCPLGLRTNAEFGDIDLYITNYNEALEDKIVLLGEIFYKLQNNEYDHLSANKCELGIYKNNDININLIIFKKNIHLYNILDNFDISLCKMYIRDLNTTNWEVGFSSEVSEIFETGVCYVQCDLSEDLGFKHTNTLERIEKYKKRFPHIKFIMEL